MTHNNIKLAIVGSRTFSDYNLLERHINDISESFNIIKIISGGAHGADKLGEKYANINKIPTLILKADWGKYKKAAGVIRNKDIVDSSDKVVAFWDGKSKGTLNSINLAKKQNKLIQIIEF